MGSYSQHHHHHHHHHHHRKAIAGSSCSPRHLVSPVTGGTTNGISSHNTLSAYDALNDDAWDTDGVVPFEDALVNLCPQQSTATIDSNSIAPAPPPSIGYDADTSSRFHAPSSDTDLKWNENMHVGVKSMLSKIALDEKVDWARQAPSINPEFGEFGVPIDVPSFCPSQRTESSGPSSTDADSFVLTPGLDLGTQPPIGASATCASGRFAWTTAVSLDEDDLTELSCPNELNTMITYPRSYSITPLSDHDSYLLPQAEIYPVPPGYCMLKKSECLVDTFPDDGVLRKRRRYAVHSHENANFPCHSTSTFAPCLATELPQTRIVHSNNVSSPLTPIGSPEFDLPTTITSNGQESFTELTLTDSIFSQQFSRHSSRLPTLRRLLDTQMPDASSTAHIMHT
ncbi:unnamed protein product [Echinostoma caproni]|uniref:Protein aurora borealis n=1 Tax=Echinostoma caproni TaxID=27848 RepID=A0A183BBF6_9TREM|nr:unnamed protein product [Echinostoma caproni]